MAVLPLLYKRLRAIGDDFVDRAMAAALPTADPLAVRLIALTLLERKKSEGLLALLKLYQSLPAEIQDTIIRHVDDFYAPMRLAVRLDARHTTAAANTIHIIRRARATRLAYLVADQLNHGSQPQRRLAAACLLDLARWACTYPTESASGSSPHAFAPADAAGYLHDVIQRSVVLFDRHEQASMLLALAAMSPRPLPEALKALADPQGKAGPALARLLRQSDDPHLQRFLPSLLALPTLRSRVIEAMVRANAPAVLPHLLACAHLLGDGRLARQLQAYEHGASLVPSAAAVHDLPIRSMRLVPTWLAAIGMESAERVRVLAQLSGCPDAPTRLSVLRRLIALADDPQAFGANDVIAGYTSDLDPALASIALRHLLKINWESLPMLLLQLVNSPHPRVRDLAQQRLAPWGFERLWEAWPTLDDQQRLDAGRALLKIDTAFHRQLGHKLKVTEPAGRLRALSMITVLQQGDFFEPALVRLVGSPNDKIVSAAVSALGTCTSEAAKALLEKAMRHRDPRVRANAVEAMRQHLSAGHLHQLAAMAGEDQQRPRANAIAALMHMRTGDALTALGRMLFDQRPAHRASALWLVGELGVLDVARQVAELSVSDPDQDIKQRAGDVIHQLMQQMHQRPAMIAPQAG